MQKISLIIAFIGLVGCLSSQAQAYEGTAEFDKKKFDAFLIDFAYAPEAVEIAIVNKMEKAGLKAVEEKGIFNKNKGYKVYKTARIAEISSGAYDYFFKADKKQGSSKNVSVLTMMIQTNGSSANASIGNEGLSGAKFFLNSLLPYVEAADLELQIKDQEAVVAKSTKKLKGLQDDKADMEKKIEKLKKDIESNIKNQEAAESENKNNQSALDQLKGKRK